MPITADVLKNHDLAGSGVILFGAGTTGGLVADLLINFGIPVRFFLDNYSSCEEKNGIRIYHPDRCPLSAKERQKAIILVSIGGIPNFNIDDERVKFAGLGFDNCSLLSG